MTKRQVTGVTLLILGVLAACVAGAAYLVGARHRRHVAVRSTRGANVLLLTLDTTRADRLGCYGGEGGATPYLDALAARGVLFEQAQSAAPITLPAHVSLLSGAYPFRHAVRNNGMFVVRGDLPTLATTFAAAGYDTAAFVSAYVLARRYGLDRGFGVYDDDLSQGRHAERGTVPDRRAEVTVNAAMRWLEQRSATRPFFCWVHLYDPHAPYDPPEELRRRFPGEPYLGEIAYADSQLTRLGGYLAERGLEANTFIVAVGDHGESFGEHGEQTHGILLHQATLRVPLILAGPGLPAGLRVPTSVSGVDLYPTLCELAGVHTAAPADGRSLLPLIARREAGADHPLYAETLLPHYQYGWRPLRLMRRGGWEVVAGARVETFDLRRDPRELTDLSAREPATTAALAADLEALAGPAAAEPVPEAGLSRGEEEMLFALGYLSPVSAERPDPPDPRDLIGAHVHMERARGLLGAGLLDQAVGELDAMLALDATNLAALSQRAEALARLGRRQEAERDARRCLELDPGDAQGYRLLARFELERGDPAAALALARAGAGKRGAFETLTVLQASALEALGRLEEARRLLTERLAARPDDPDLLLACARSRLADGNRNGAEELLRRAVAVDALHFPSRAALATLLERDGRPEEALALLRERLKVDPGHAEAHLRIGVLLGARPTEARPHLEEAVRLAPRDVQANVELGLCYLRLNEPRRAEARFRRALELEPDSAEVRNDLAIALTLLGRYAEAEAELRAVLAERPRFAQARNNLALCLLYQNRLAEAEAAAGQALAVEPELRDARLTRSSVLAAQGRHAEAEQELAPLLRADPGNSELKARMGIELAAQGRYATALPLLREAWPAFAGNLEVLRALAASEEHAGSRREAMALFEQVARASPRGAARDEAIAALERLAGSGGH